jgi:ribosomal protein L11 methyltransferase
LGAVLSDEGSFGTGAHPTTRACLKLLVALESRGSFADLGCGSGVLAIVASSLGFSPVLALDADPFAVAAARANAARNRVDVEARDIDLNVDTPSAAEFVAANVPLAIHVAIAPRLSPSTRYVLATGVTAGEGEALLSVYRSAGFRPVREHLEQGWAAFQLDRL